MDEDDSFVCDWFVIGGRFSGWLINVGKHSTASYTHTMTSRSLHDYHNDEGTEDDAMLVDPELYLNLLAQYEGKAVGQRMEQLAFLDMDGERVSPQFVRKKWIVVVDYHS